MRRVQRGRRRYHNRKTEKSRLCLQAITDCCSSQANQCPHQLQAHLRSAATDSRSSSRTEAVPADHQIHSTRHQTWASHREGEEEPTHDNWSHNNHHSCAANNEKMSQVQEEDDHQAALRVSRSKLLLQQKTLQVVEKRAQRQGERGAMRWRNYVVNLIIEVIVVFCTFHCK